MKKILLFTLFTVLVSAVTALTVVKLSDSDSNYGRYGSQGLPIQKVNFTGESFPDFTYAAESAVKSVVHVKVVKRGYESQYSIFDFFFGYTPDRVPREQMGAGSGVIITSDGYVVTNNHVIEGADEITVTTDNNKSYKAKLVGSDAVTDVALLKIDEGNLPFMTFGSSDSLRLGEWVLAIGNPYNLRSTVTAGIVSAKARSMPSIDGEFKIEAFIQTDAAVNPGNSGGALINTKGELVGINTAIASRTGSYTGYSFAVPSTIVKKVVEDFIKYGSVKRALMGISMQDIDGDLAKDKGIKDIKGVYIAEIAKGGAAESAGIKEGDVLLSINGIDVNSSPAVQEQISRYRPNEKIKVKILREGKEREFSVTLQSKSTDIAMGGNDSEGLSTIFGAKIKNATDSSLKKLGVRNGVEVISVGDGKLKNAGVRTGFIITHINQIPVKSVQEAVSVIQRSNRSILLEGIYPDGTVMYYGMGV